MFCCLWSNRVVDELRMENAELRKERDALRDENVVLQEEKAVLHTDNDQLQQEKSVLKQEKSVLEQENSVLVKQIKKLTSDADRGQQDSASLTRIIGWKNQTLASRQAKVEILQSEKMELVVTMKALTDSLKTAISK